VEYSFSIAGIDFLCVEYSFSIAGFCFDKFFQRWILIRCVFLFLELQ